MDWISLLRDPLWQGVGAILTGISVVITIVLIPNVRNLVLALLKKIAIPLNWGPVHQTAFQIFVACAIFITSSELINKTFQIDTTIVSVSAFALFSITLIAEYHSRKTYALDWWLLIFFSIVYLVVGGLALREGRHSKIGNVVFSSEFQILIFGLLIFFILRLEIIAHFQSLAENLKAWTEWIKNENTRIGTSIDARIQETITEAKLAATTELPRWWQFLEKVKAENKRVRDSDNKDFDFYEFLLDCGYEVNHVKRVLIIKPPQSYFSTKWKRSIKDRKKILQDLFALAGTVFQGYEIDYAGERWTYEYD